MSQVTALYKLESFVRSEGYMGYDPYDTLLSWFPFHWLGKWGPILAIQFQKRNPINIRPLLGIKKGINPKAFGLFLHAYSTLYAKTNDPKYLEQARYFFSWLKEHYSEDYSGKCWGYNFPWASTLKYMPSYTPSGVVTGFVVKGLYAYYQVTKDQEVADEILSACRFVLKDLPRHGDNAGQCISYTPIKKDICYNASLLAAEVLAYGYTLCQNEEYKQLAIDCVNYVVDKQQESGVWYYSMDLASGQERKQIDFHQGYVIDSIFLIGQSLEINKPEWKQAVKRGLDYYKAEQFDPKGKSHWRVPKEYPVEIHNQAQGIISFYRHSEFREFSRQIATWTVDNMQSTRGHFYYRIFKSHTNRIPFMRWSQAWMFLALSTVLEKEQL